MAETPEARSRRRWITLGELVGICALIVSALSYWDAHRERVATRVPAATAARAGPLLLTGTVDAAGDRIALKPAGADQVVETQTIRFPSMVRKDAVETTGNAHIEAAWFETGLRTALKDRKLHSGRHRLPVVIETSYASGATTATDHALYDLGYSLHGRLLRPDAVTIEGISLVRRSTGDLQADADARFVRSIPAE
jgi:hypothetical protein